MTFVTEKGPASGRIRGINHLFFLVEDMETSVRFYRDLLGFKVVRTNRRSSTSQSTGAVHVVTTYFFDIGFGNDMLFGLYEVVRAPANPGPGPEPSIATRLWPGDSPGVVNPRKMDHLAFNVDTHDELVWFCEHLRSHGVEVTDISTRFNEEFGESIYFYDPNGIPLEIATFDWADPRWGGRHGPSESGVWLRDVTPVPALRAE